MREWNWIRIAVGAILVVIGGVLELTVEGTSIGWPLVVLGVAAVLLGIFPAFSVKDAAWALALGLGFVMLITGICDAYPHVGSVRTSDFVVLGGLFLVIGDSFAVSNGIW
jgi:hypothetical protein